MKKILFYIPSFQGGGAERNAVLIARHYGDTGFDVTVVVDRDEGPNRDLLPDMIHIVSLEGDHHLTQIRSLRHILRHIRPDVVFVFLGFGPTKIILAALGIVTLRKIIIGYNSLYDPYSPLGGRLTYLFSSVFTMITGGSIAVSSDIKHELATRFFARSDKIHVIHNPVDLKWIEEQSSKENPSWLNPGTKYILSVGRLVYQKDYPTLIRAFANMKDTYEHHLIILGEGPLRPALEELVSSLNLCDRVMMPGYDPNPFPLYKHASLFVLSSTFEGFGNVLVEALAVGTPVVAVDGKGGPKDILCQGRFGKLVPVGNPDELAQAMTETIRQPIPKGMLKKRAEDFSVKIIASAYLKVGLNSMNSS